MTALRSAVPIACGLVVAAAPLCAQSAPAATDPTNVTNEYRVTIFPHYPITKSVSGFGYIGWVDDAEAGYKLYYFGAPGFIWTVKPWLQQWTALLAIYTNNDRTVNAKEDTMELRPFIGAKLLLPNSLRWNIYNFTRFEFREVYHHDTHAWTNTQRIRARFGVEIPLTSRDNAWHPKTFYAIANVEPMYRYDHDVIDPARAQVGLAYIVNTRIRAEGLYYANWDRVSSDNDLVFTKNIIRLNVKVGLSHAILGGIWNPDRE
jgi:hypothetical protein